MQSNFYKVDALPLLMGFTKRSLIKARATKAEAPIIYEPCAVSDQKRRKARQPEKQQPSINEREENICFIV